MVNLWLSSSDQNEKLRTSDTKTLCIEKKEKRFLRIYFKKVAPQINIHLTEIITYQLTAAASAVLGFST
jgi:hypothetical protein